MKQFKKLLSVVLSLFMIFTTMTPQFMAHIHAAQTYDTSDTAIQYLKERYHKNYLLLIQLINLQEFEKIHM